MLDACQQKLKAFIPPIPEKQNPFIKIFWDYLLHEDDYALQFDANGTQLRITTVAELRPQEFTVLGWNVDDISSSIRALNDPGVFVSNTIFFRRMTLESGFRLADPK